VIEIDAATHSGVATIRELRNQAQFSPVQGNYKVYIIDECHQLSAGAANALLKTLEEPPDPIKFILATTEEYKVIPTIKSRCQVHRFGLVHKGLLVKHLKHILQAESQFLSDETIEVIAEEARGAVRDALSLLEMVLHLSDNSAENVRLAFGRASHEDVSGFMDLISDRNLAGAFAYCHDLQEKRRVDMKGFQIELIIWLRGLIHLLARSSVFEHAWVEKMREQAWTFSIEDLLMCVQVLQKQTHSIRFPTMALEMAAVEMCANLPEVMDF
jgi:DNA polymerase-3 subunit gamma/tau